MSVTPTKGDMEERWSSGSRWDGGAEGETLAMDGLGGIVQAVDAVVSWRVKLGFGVGRRRKSKFQVACARRPGRRSLVRVPKQAAGSRGVSPTPLLFQAKPQSTA